MATRNSTTAQKSTGRRPGRPTNASKAAAVQSQQSMIVDMATAAASAAVKAALGIVEGGVQTLGIAQPSSTNASATQTAPASTSGTQKRASATVTNIGKKSPGRKVQADSKATLTREFYDANLKAAKPLNRAEFVAAATEKFGYSKQTANTYVSNIESKNGYKLVSRSDPSKRGQKRAKKKAA